MLLQYESVLTLLKNVNDPSKVNQVDDQITYRCQDPSFLHLVLNAIHDRNNSLDLKLTATVVLAKIIREQKCGDRQSINVLMGILIDQSISIRVKQAIQETITNLLEFCEDNDFKEVLFQAITIINKMPKLHHQQLTVQASDQNMEQFRAALLLVKCLNDSNAHFGILSAFFMQQLLQAIINIQYPHSVKGINSIVSVLNLLKDIMQRVLLETTQNHTEMMKWMARSQVLTEWIFQIYKIDCLPLVPSLINVSSAFDHSHMSELKSAAANLHCMVLRAIQRSKQNKVQELASRHNSQTMLAIHTIALHSQHPQRSRIAQSYEQFATSLVTLLIYLVKTFPKEVAPVYNNIIHIVIFPLLATPESQVQLFKDDHAQFNNLAEDCCDKQVYGVLKTQTAKLLQTVCDQYASVGQYIVQHAIISLKVRLSLDPNFAANTQHFLPLDQSLLVLSILSYRLGKYPRELKEMASVLSVQNVIAKANELDLARAFLLMAYNFQQIFPDSKQGQAWIYLALKTTVHQSKQCPTLAFTALDFISNVIQIYFTQNFAMAFLRQCAITEDDLQFKIFSKILSRHYMNFSEQGLGQALDALYRGMVADAYRYQKQIKSHTMDISQAFQIVRKICQKKQLLASDKTGTLKSKIWQFIANITYFSKLHIDDEVIKILISLIKTQGVTTQIQQFLPIILKLYNQGGYNQTPYIIFLNEIIMRASRPHQLLLPLMQATKQLIFAVRDTPTAVTDKLALGNSLLVLQHTMAMFGEQLQAQIIGRISQLGYMIAPISDEPESKAQPIIIARSLNLIFLCHMHHKDDSALGRLLQFQDACIFRSHDLRVLAICLTKEIFRESDLVAVTEMINMLIKAIWYSHPGNNGPQIRSKKNNISLKKPTVIRIKKIADYELSLKSMTQPFDKNTIPELQLKTTLQKMNNSNQLLLHSIMNSFPKQHQQKLRQIMSQVTIQGQTRKIRHVGAVKNNVTVEGLPHRGMKRQVQRYSESSEDENEDSDSGGEKIQRKKIKKQHCIDQQP